MTYARTMQVGYIAGTTCVQIWDDLSSERLVAFRAFWTNGPGDTTGCPVVGYCSPGGSWPTIRQAAQEVRRLGYTDPIYRNGRLLKY